MAIEIISTLKPKNNGTFPIAEAKDIDVNGTRLDEKLESMGESGVGIVSIEKTGTSGLVDTYTITLTDGTTYTFTVTNGADGKGIESIAFQNSTTDSEGRKVDNYIITYTSGSKTAFTVTNGKDGNSGITEIALSGANGTLTSAQLTALNASPEDFAFAYTDSTSGQKSVMRYTASSGSSRLYTMTYLTAEEKLNALLCVVSIGTGGYNVTQKKDIALGGGTGGGSYVLELSAESGTLTDEQWTALVANAPNVVAVTQGMTFQLSLVVPEMGMYQFTRFYAENADENGNSTTVYYITLDANAKTVEFGGETTNLASKTYVDNAVANAGGGSSSGGGATAPTVLHEGSTPTEIKNAIANYTQKGAMAYWIEIADEETCALVGATNSPRAAYFMKSTTKQLVVVAIDETNDTKTVSYVDLGGSGGGGIIDVTELPTENIDEKAIYRMTENLYFRYPNGYIEKWGTTYVVDELPTTGEPCTTTGTDLGAVYYQTKDGVLYGYVPAAVGSALGVPEGWYQVSMLLQELGYDYAGVVTSYSSMTGGNTFYFLAKHAYLACKDGVWTELSGGGSSGGGGIVEKTFSTLAELALFIMANPSMVFLKAQLNGKSFSVTVDETRYQATTLTAVDVAATSTEGFGIVSITTVTSNRIVAIELYVDNGAVYATLAQINFLDGTGPKQATFNDLASGGVTAWFATT